MNDPKPPAKNLDDELEKAMAEAAASVGSASDPGPGASGGEADADPAAEGAPEALKARIAELEAQVADLQDKRLRALADLENMKKRVRREMEDAALRRVQEVLLRVLPTVDNLERALDAAGVGEADAVEERLAQLIKGIEMVRDEFLKALAEEGIRPIDAVGRPFDPQLHDALHQEDSPEHPPGVVLREFEKGYVQGNRLLRPARVVVAGPGSKGERKETSE